MALPYFKLFLSRAHPLVVCSLSFIHLFAYKWPVSSILNLTWEIKHGNPMPTVIVVRIRKSIKLYELT